MNRKLIVLPLVLLLTLCFSGYARAQAPTGFTKIATITSGTTLTYLDTTESLNTVYAYVITATANGTESVPSNVFFAAIPPTAPAVANPACNNLLIHCVSLAWTEATTGTLATGFNVYRQIALPPPAPSALTGAVN